jgi:hypothetical protein
MNKRARHKQRPRPDGARARGLVPKEALRLEPGLAEGLAPRRSSPRWRRHGAGSRVQGRSSAGVDQRAVGGRSLELRRRHSEKEGGATTDEAFAPLDRNLRGPHHRLRYRRRAHLRVQMPVGRMRLASSRRRLPHALAALLLTNTWGRRGWLRPGPLLGRRQGPGGSTPPF